MASYVNTEVDFRYVKATSAVVSWNVSFSAFSFRRASVVSCIMCFQL